MMDSLTRDLEYYTTKRKLFVESYEKEKDRFRDVLDLYFNPMLKVYANRYHVLSDILEEFGRRHLLPPVRELFPKKVKSVVDWGPGTGWLGYELARDRLTYVDKRLLLNYTGSYQETLDLELIGGATPHQIKLLSAGSDLSVVCEVLHCISKEAQIQLLKNIASSTLLLIEQLPEGETGEAAQQQIQLLSGQPLLTGTELSMLLSQTMWNGVDSRHVAHYTILKARKIH